VFDLVLLCLGGALLYFGAEWLVGGSSDLALSLCIPKLIVGLTVVAYGTSAPEVVVSVQAALSDHGALALGNVIGSNIANLGLILGLSALIKPALVDGALRQRELPMLLGTAFLLPLLLRDGMLQRWEAAGLVAGAILYSLAMVRSARGSVVEARDALESTLTTAAAAETAGTPSSRARWLQAATALAGLLILLLGGRLFVEAASGLARAWGMSERVVGLTVVAVGTSLPELATSLIAAFRGHSDIAVGNIVGSNIFNILLCIGVGGLVRPIPADLAALRIDLLVLLAMTVFGAIAFRTERTVSRGEGAFLFVAYVAYMAHLLRSSLNSAPGGG
jgi:cation:H+ antiporter